MCDERFGAVREAFAKNFAQGLEVGASFAAVHDGEMVCDLWAGARDAKGSPWERDTLVNVFSTTKAMAALTTLMLVDRGELDLDPAAARARDPAPRVPVPAVVEVLEPVDVESGKRAGGAGRCAGGRQGHVPRSAGVRRRPAVPGVGGSPRRREHLGQ